MLCSRVIGHVPGSEREKRVWNSGKKRKSIPSRKMGLRKTWGNTAKRWESLGNSGKVLETAGKSWKQKGSPGNTGKQQGTARKAWKQKGSAGNSGEVWEIEGKSLGNRRKVGEEKKIPSADRGLESFENTRKRSETAPTMLFLCATKSFQARLT